ncbi:MAG TPA: polysaccharide biosynthesis protein [Candidatus Fimimorpha faecalis]|uniref:Polysaccharide biosynthesis protein n=1 Tax=Candidatus Fimimorpha faecalis TaxID=2840824 RepID=A0A9D1EBY3_9FIRM|nr:polysaccharide biosynthesis protein [Candidatus Fimimorpha faecalis]
MKKIRETVSYYRQQLKHWYIVALLLVGYDIVAVNMAYFFALWFRFDCKASMIPGNYFSAYLKFIPIYSICCVFIFWMLRLYQSIWRFASYSEMLRIIMATVITSVVHVVGITVLFERMPISYYLVGMGIQFLLVLGVRFSYRFILLERSRRHGEETYTSRVMLIGAGAAGQMILRDSMKSKETNVKICCIIDDNSNKWNRYIEGVPIVGGREEILLNVEKYHIDKIFLAIPSASAEEKRDILNICKETGCELKNLPGLYQFVTGEVSIKAMKDVAVEDLLGRDPIQVNMEEIFQYIRGKTILVTGGGGSIGSELCRQIAGHEPRQLIIFDIYENNAYDIEQELKEKYPYLNLKVLIGSVRDSRRIQQVFETYQPEIVYHAAAHKHVPLMEVSPCEAIKNNVIGTYKTAYAAMLNGCQRFVLISTDKAVNPTNIMGASKRLCEMVIQAFDRAIKEGTVNQLPNLFTHKEEKLVKIQTLRMNAGKENSIRTEFVAVRFGNVLGSNGSVIPLFKKQIQKGGPVTVTHPDIIRYFMTIPEAVSLVLQAGTYAKGGEIFVLDMGVPVKIDTLARNLIKLSGYKPDIDIKVTYTGLRPGEKLYEEKLMAEEGMRKTPNKLIHIGNPIPFDQEQFLLQLNDLMQAAYENRGDIRRIVEQMVSTYHPAINGSEKKGKIYQELYGEIAATKAE